MLSDRLRLWACSFSLLLVCTAAYPDTVTLKDGAKREGTITAEDELSIVLQVRIGTMNGSVTIPKTEILSITRRPLAPDTVLSQGQELKQSAEMQTDPAKAVVAWQSLAEHYAKQPGYHAYVKSAWEKVLLFEPDHAVARAKLGFMKGDKGWFKPAPKISEELVQKPPLPRQEDDLVISLRKDAETIRKNLEEQAARLEEIEEAERRVAAARYTRQSQPWNDTYIVTREGVYWYPPYSSVMIDEGVPYGYGRGWGSPFVGGVLSPIYSDGYLSNNGCYNTGYGYSSGYSSGLWLGFSGRWGSVRVNGVLNSGYSSYGSRGGTRFGF